ncbi:hypothetical protein MTBSS4_170024 [Magnetospirillum sp. SS-4]|nr:hypothetical protein MTBSS4_170024 [Magnetospirillum sp. SS-4]
MGGDNARSPVSQVLPMFQSTPPRGGRRAGMCLPQWAVPGFNPRPRVGGDGRYGHHSAEDPVSIHAPAWGATPA